MDKTFSPGKPTTEEGKQDCCCCLAWSTVIVFSPFTLSIVESWYTWPKSFLFMFVLFSLILRITAHTDTDYGTRGHLICNGSTKLSSKSKSHFPSPISPVKLCRHHNLLIT